MWWHVDEHVLCRHVVRHLSHNVMCAEGWQCRERLVWGCSVHTPPSVTVDRFQLWTKPTVTKERDLSKIFLWTHFQLHSDAYHHEELWDENQFIYIYIYIYVYISCMLINSSAGQVIFGENFLSLSYASLLTWMDGFFDGLCKRFFIMTAAV